MHDHDTQSEQYVCPMHPEVVRNAPGRCPECGMNLVPSKGAGESHGDKHTGHKTSSFLTKFWIVLVLTVPILLYSELFEFVFGFSLPVFPGMQWVILLLGSIVYFYGGAVFLSGAKHELRGRLPGMMTLIALAITAAYAFSVWQVFRGEEHTLFWELSTLIAVMLFGHWVEMKAVQGTQGALKELAALLPDTAEVIRDGETQQVSLDELKEGETVLVKPGAKIPADGVIVEGRSSVDESIVTGESKPVSKNVEDEVIAGTINGDGSLKIRVTQIGEHTFLAGVMRLVAEAQSSKSRLQTISDRAALYLTVIAVVVGSVTFVVWLLLGAGGVFAVERLVAVLVITCPHALGLAVPLVASISTTMAAKQGFLVRERIALESARDIDVVLFDKTGTLTKGAFGVHQVVPAEGVTEKDVLSLAASVNAESEHSLAKAIVMEANDRSISLASVTGFERLPGKGAKALVDGEEVFIGSDALLAEHDLTLSNEHAQVTDALEKEGKTVVHVLTKNKFVGSIALADVIREESRNAVRQLKDLNIKTVMITGDSDEVAAWVAQELQLDQYFSRVLPAQKSEKVKSFQGQGLRVAMVGDGVNDAPALMQADLGIAVGAGTNVAIESAGIVLMKNDPRDIPKIIRLSKLTYVKMIQNLFWATGYNIVALPLAAGVLIAQGIVLQPAIAAVFMSLSTVIVAVNAMLLRRRTL